MKNINYKNVLQHFYNHFEEFKKYPDFVAIADDGNDDSQYVVLGVFWNFYLETFLDGNKSWIEKANIFLESLAASSDNKLKELLMFGFLEYLNPNEDYYSNIVGAFGSKTKVLLKETIEHNEKIAGINTDKDL